MNKKVLYEKISKIVKSYINENLDEYNIDDIKIYVIYDDYTQTYSILTSLTPEIDTLLKNADSYEEFDSMLELVDYIDNTYDNVYDKWGDEYFYKSKYYIVYNDYNKAFLLKTYDQLKHVGFELYPIVDQSDDLTYIKRKLDTLI